MGEYQIRLTPKWVERITDDARPSRTLFEVVNDLAFQLRSVEVTSSMPFALVNGFRTFVTTYTSDHKRRARKLVAETLLRLSSQVRYPPDPTFHQDYAITCHRVAAECEQMNITPPFSVEEVWSSFLQDKGFRFSLWSAMRDGFVKAYMNYEDFLTRCLAIETRKLEYRKPDYRQYVKDFTAAFGQSTTNTCLQNKSLSRSRLIRDAIAHNGGRHTKDDEELLEGFKLLGGRIHILPHNLVSELRTIERGVREMVTVALKRDAFKNPV